MKLKLMIVVFVVSLLPALTGCARTQRVTVAPDTSNVTVPYESLGWIEVDKKVPLIPCKRIFGQLWEWMTFGHYEMGSRDAYLQGRLDKKMIKAAKKRYRAEAIVNAQYWPDLNSKTFPQGKTYAKGEMVRLKRFAE